MARSRVTGTINRSGLVEILNADGRQHLAQIGADAVAYVTTNTGIDSGDLRSSLGFRVQTTQQGPVLTAGSGVATGLGPIVYGPAHWSGDRSLMAGIPTVEQRGLRPARTRTIGRGRSTYPGRKPWTRFLNRAQGITYRRTPGAPEV